MARVFYFDDEALPAQRLAQLCGLPCIGIDAHRFPDDEVRLQLPLDEHGKTPRELIIYRGLDHPNEKLITLLLAVQEARRLGSERILLVAPYLAYMRQDIAFHPGEVISQQVIGRFLSTLVDGVITVDPHLHRINRLEEAIPLPFARAISGADVLADCIAQHHTHPLLMGPDGESAQWVARAAQRKGWDHCVCTKVRHGDHDVEIQLPEMDVVGRAVVLIDDIASSGRTIAKATQLLMVAGASSVDVGVTHALFAHDALTVIQQAGVRHVWSTDCVAHASNAISIASALAVEVKNWLSFKENGV